MNEMHFYPLGTVVRLRGRKEHYLISGYLRGFTDGVVCDYSAVRYPLGYDGMRSVLSFSTKDVETVVFEGLKDAACNKLLEMLPRLREAVAAKTAEEAERLRSQAAEKQQLTQLEE